MNEQMQELLTLIRSELDLDDDDELTTSSTPDSVENWDSLGHLRICMAIESKFGIRIPMDKVGELTSVQALSSLLPQT